MSQQKPENTDTNAGDDALQGTVADQDTGDQDNSEPEGQQEPQQ